MSFSNEKQCQANERNKRLREFSELARVREPPKA